MLPRIVDKSQGAGCAPEPERSSAMINLGILIDRQPVPLDCSLAGSAEGAWFYLTQAEGLAAWLADGALETRIEGNVRLRFPAGESPMRSPSGGLVYGQVERCEPYRLLTY